MLRPLVLQIFVRLPKLARISKAETFYSISFLFGFMPDKVKILVGCPTSDHKAYCLKEYAEGIKAMEGEFDVLVVDNSQTEEYVAKIVKVGLPAVRGPLTGAARERIVACRNVLRDKVLNEGYDWFFSLEQDVIPPPGVLARLLSAKRKIITGVYTKEFKKMQDGKLVGRVVRPLLYMIHNGNVAQMEMDDLEPPRVQEVFSAGLGCMLIHRSVLEKVTFRWDPNFKAFDDMFFSTDAMKQGFKKYADTSIRCEHLEMSWEGIEK